MRAAIPQFRRDRRGAVSVLFGFSVVAVVGFLGLATDAGRGYIAKARLGQAVDAAALAGGKAINQPYRDDEIRKYFQANFPNDYMDSVLVDFDIEAGEGNEQLTISATARIPTTFMRIVNVDDMEVSARSVVKRSVRGLELALIMDNTGSMLSGNKIGTMKAAATDLVNILYGEKETINNFWVGLVPFVATVNVGNQHVDWLHELAPTTTIEGNKVLIKGGTPFGNTDRGAGVPAVFDGNRNQVFEDGGYRQIFRNAPFDKRYVVLGKEWDDEEAKTVAGYRLTSPSNYGFVTFGSQKAIKMVFVLQGSDDGVSWNTLHVGRGSFTKRGGVTTQRTLTFTGGIDMSTAYRHHRLVIGGNIRKKAIYLFSEVEFFEEADEDVETVWKGCVEARPSPLDESDDPPSVELFTRHFWPSTINDFGDDQRGDNDWPDIDERNEARNEGTGPNLGCGPPITSLTAEKTKVLAAIDEMQSWSRGGTHANLGLAWGWRVISPRWRGLWGGDTPDNLPMDYDAPLMDKVAIILTDGTNVYYDWPDGLPGRPLSGTYPDTDYSAYGRLSEGRLGTTNQAAAVVEINNRMSRLCQNMKDEGIVIYAITFQLNDVATQNLMRNCATDPEKYYNSPSNEELRATFVAIGNELTNLRIAE
ncbi:TadE/TadG family type IV pilus assembly protein [Denitrobaculum tricleocarpae]|uniref:TadE/TadG family type IV pilus assembly protein n=1 Tax=Denitrobaculum tricleocarpae TaxID=2591009 RepID=UPI0015D3419A|nr:TadE/TadG family type IV pilus assembly protein [Denitrobaculum tricleocarpae]